MTIPRSSAQNSKMGKPTEFTKGPVARTNQLFLELRRFGELDEKGRVRFALGYKGKVIAHPDMPLALLAQLTFKIIQNFNYSSPEAAAKDLKGFQEWANGLKLENS